MKHKHDKISQKNHIIVKSRFKGYVSCLEIKGWTLFPSMFWNKFA